MYVQRIYKFVDNLLNILHKLQNNYFAVSSLFKILMVKPFVRVLNTLLIIMVFWGLESKMRDYSLINSYSESDSLNLLSFNGTEEKYLSKHGGKL